MKHKLNIESIKSELRAEGDADEMAATYNALLMAARQTLTMAVSFAPCVGPESELMQVIEQLESCKL